MAAASIRAVLQERAKEQKAKEKQKRDEQNFSGSLALRQYIVDELKVRPDTLFLANVAIGKNVNYYSDSEDENEEEQEGLVDWDEYEGILPNSQPPFMSEWHWESFQKYFLDLNQKGEAYDPSWIQAYHRHQLPPEKMHLTKRPSFAQRELEAQRWAEMEAMHASDPDSPKPEPLSKPEELPMAPKHIQFANLFAYANQRMCADPYFSALVIACIVIAGILVGIQSYPSMDGKPALTAVDDTVQIIFTCECLFKIFAEGRNPLRYWTGPEWGWNNFDFWLVFICWIPMGGNVAFLRLLRLMRLVKLVGKVKQLQVIVSGLVKGLSSVSYIMLLMFLVFYLFAVMGVGTFRKNDPFHFGSLGTAMLTLFRCATLEDWSDVMYINMFGCDSQYGGVYGSYVGKDGGDPSVPGDLGTRNTAISTDMGDFYSYECWHPSAQPVISSGFFIMFILIAAFVIMSLFVGAVCGGMYEALDAFKKQDKVDKQLKEERLKAKEEADRASNPNDHFENTLRDAFDAADEDGSGEVDAEELVAMLADFGDHDITIEKAEQLIIKTNGGDPKQTSLTLPSFVLLMTVGALAPSDLEISEEDFKMAVEKARVMDMVETNRADLMVIKIRKAWAGDLSRYDFLSIEEGWFKEYLKLSVKAQKVALSSWFTNCITITILAAGVVVGVQTEMAVPGETVVSPTLDALDNIILAIFTVDVVLKMVAEGDTPLKYFNDSWNIFDFFIVFACFIFMLPFMPEVGSMLAMLRLLRLLRVLKLVKALPELRIIIEALISGFGSITFVVIILFMFFYLYANIGMILFRENDPMHFGNLQTALMSLFRAATLDDWTDIMYIQMFGCDLWAYEFGRSSLGFDEMGRVKEHQVSCKNPQRNGWVGAVYMVVFVVIGALVLLTLFIGIVATAMEEAKADQKEEAKRELRLNQKSELLEIGTGPYIGLYRALFDELDNNGNGSISQDELKPLLRCLPRLYLERRANRQNMKDSRGECKKEQEEEEERLSMTKIDLDKLIQVVDNEYDGNIAFEEFIVIVDFLRRVGDDENVLARFRESYMLADEKRKQELLDLADKTGVDGAVPTVPINIAGDAHNPEDLKKIEDLEAKVKRQAEEIACLENKMKRNLNKQDILVSEFQDLSPDLECASMDDKRESPQSVAHTQPQSRTPILSMRSSSKVAPESGPGK